jgi:hypothetical protein
MKSMAGAGVVVDATAATTSTEAAKSFLIIWAPTR